jgi:long-subunit acyl-CoA synthetase (AMP-forming)
VAVQVEKSPAVLRHGFQRVELARIADEQGRLGVAEEIGDLGRGVAEAAGQTGDFADVARSPDDLAAILYTSGTTGRSKGTGFSASSLPGSQTNRAGSASPRK